MPHYYLAHLDADCFFCQVHHLATDLPPETPLVVQQQYDIISVNYPARALGIKKHQSPLEIKQKYPRVHVVQAHWTGTKVSYQPYRAASSTIFTLVKDKAREHATVPIHFERTSIDEGYLIFQFPNLVASSFESQEEEEDNDSGNGICSTPTAAPTSFSAALQDQDDYIIECQRVVQLIRNDVLAQCGFHLSAGIGPTKLLAKLASKNAKPKGQTSLTLKEYHEECDHLLVDSLSSYTRAVDQQLQRSGCSHDGTLKSIRQYGEQQLIRALGTMGDTVGRRLHDQLWGGQKAEKNEVLTRDTTSHLMLEHDKWFKSSLSSRVSLTSSVVESMLNKNLSYESRKSHKTPANAWYSRRVIMKNAQDVYPFLNELIAELTCRLDEDAVEYSTFKQARRKKKGTAKSRVPTKLILTINLEGAHLNHFTSHSCTSLYPSTARYINKNRGERFLHAWKSNEAFSLQLKNVLGNDDSHGKEERRRLHALQETVHQMHATMMRQNNDLGARVVVRMTVQAGSFEKVDHQLTSMFAANRNGGGVVVGGVGGVSSSSSNNNNSNNNSSGNARENNAPETPRVVVSHGCTNDGRTDVISEFTPASMSGAGNNHHILSNGSNKRPTYSNDDLLDVISEFTPASNTGVNHQMHLIPETPQQAIETQTDPYTQPPSTTPAATTNIFNAFDVSRLPLPPPAPLSKQHCNTHHGCHLPLSLVPGPESIVPSSFSECLHLLINEETDIFKVVQRRRVVRVTKKVSEEEEKGEEEEVEVEVEAEDFLPINKRRRNEEQHQKSPSRPKKKWSSKSVNRHKKQEKMDLEEALKRSERDW